MPVMPHDAQGDCMEVLELWDCEPWEASNRTPAWTWEIIREPGTARLINPIIFPCSQEWKLRWRKRGKSIAEGKVKSFLPRSLGDSFLIYTHFVSE
jgi:hypothetical protein